MDVQTTDCDRKTIIGLCNTSFGSGTSSTVHDGGANGRFGAVLELVALLWTITVAGV